VAISADFNLAIDQRGAPDDTNASDEDLGYAETRSDESRSAGAEPDTTSKPAIPEERGADRLSG